MAPQQPQPLPLQLLCPSAGRKMHKPLSISKITVATVLMERELNLLVKQLPLISAWHPCLWVALSIDAALLAPLQQCHTLL